MGRGEEVLRPPVGWIATMPKGTRTANFHCRYGKIWLRETRYAVS